MARFGGHVSLTASYDAFAWESIAPGTVAVVFTGAIYKPAGGTAAARAVISCDTAQVRYRYDGGNPMAGSVGHLLGPGTAIAIIGISNITNFKAIREGGSNGLLNVTYEK